LNVKIGLFGGTFDPIHNGHIQICESFLNSGFIDELWIIPASIPPQKEDSVIATFEQRIAMLEIAFQSNENVKILDIEDNLPKPNYTIQTVRYLKKLHPHHEFKLCIGADNLKSLNTWFNYQDLINEIDLLVVSRPGTSIDTNVKVDTRSIHFVNHTETDISSSEIRESIREKGNTEDVPDAVLKYILDNKLYV